MPRGDHVIRAALQAQNKDLATTLKGWRECAKRAEASFEQIKEDYGRQTLGHREQGTTSNLDVSRMEERLKNAEAELRKKEVELDGAKKAHAAELEQIWQLLRPLERSK